MRLCVAIAFVVTLVWAPAAGAAVVLHTDRCVTEEQRSTRCPHSIWTVNDDGSGLRPLTPDRRPGRDGYPSVSGDGTRIFFWHTTAGRSQLWSMRRDGSGASRLGTVELPHEPVGATVSPDGTTVVFQGGQNHLFVAPVGGGPFRQLTSGPVVDQDPAFAPDGRSVAFTRAPNVLRRESLQTVEPGVYSVSIGGGVPVPLSKGGIPDVDTPGRTEEPHDVAWSPDGRALAVGGSARIYVMSRDGRTVGVSAPVLGSGGSQLTWMGGANPGIAFSETGLPLPGDSRPAPGGGPGSISGARPLYRVSLGALQQASPLTPFVERRDQWNFIGDRNPVWAPDGAPRRDSRPDTSAPAIALLDGATGRPPRARKATASRQRRRARVPVVGRGDLRFFALDPAGVRQVDASVARRVTRRRCRFLGRKRLGARERKCSVPRFRIVGDVQEWVKAVKRLPRGVYQVQVRATDRRGNRRAARRVVLRLR